MVIGGIEAGGTKMVCAVGDEAGNLSDRMTVLTGTPEDTLPRMIRYFKEKKVEALGIGCFGPLDLDRKSPGYGSITSTPKPGWAGCEILKVFREALSVPVGLDTDVNGAVLGEVLLGAAKDCDTAVYLTIGTGAGVGVYCNGALLHGLVHPEAGHLLIGRKSGDSFPGVCPFHENCLEGLASGPALEKRWGRPAAELFAREEVWELEAYYLAQAVSNYILAYSPQKVILWGGVMHQTQLFGLVRAKVRELLNGYVRHPALEEELDGYIVPPGLGDNAGIIGAIQLGRLAAERMNG